MEEQIEWVCDLIILCLTPRSVAEGITWLANGTMHEGRYDDDDYSTDRGFLLILRRGSCSTFPITSLKSPNEAQMDEMLR